MKRSGWSLEELGELSPDGWMRMYAAAMSRRIEDEVRMMAVLNPGKDPSHMQGKMKQMAQSLLKTAVLAEPEPEFWRDPLKLKRMLGGIGVPVKTRERKRKA